METFSTLLALCAGNSPVNSPQRKQRKGPYNTYSWPVCVTFHCFICHISRLCIKVTSLNRLGVSNYQQFHILDRWSTSKKSQWYGKQYFMTSSWGKKQCYGPLARYVKLLVAHAPGMPGTFFPSPRVSDPDMHHGTCFTHVPWSMSGSLTSGFLLTRWRGKRSRHSRRMRNHKFYVSAKRLIAQWSRC